MGTGTFFANCNGAKKEPVPILPVIDIHVHLAGIGDGGTGCWMSPAKYNSLVFRLLRGSLGLSGVGQTGNVDRIYLERLEQDLSAAAERGVVDGAVLFPHERIYLDDGTLAPDQEMYIPNEYALACARARLESPQPGRFLPAMSVHPYRPAAAEEVARLIEAGAAAMKWLPSSQNIDGRDKRCRPIYDLLAKHRLPLIAHSGSEHTVHVTRRDLGDPDALLPAMDAGVTVILAHCATASLPWERDFSRRFIELARRYPNCYGDTSALCAPGRSRYLRRFLDAGIADKLVHGSDYPVPPIAWLSLLRLGWRQTRQRAAIASHLHRDVAIKQALGTPEVVFTNAARLIPREILQRWGLNSVRDIGRA